MIDYISCFVTGGLLCVIAQILIDKTKLTPGRILVIYVCSGVVLTAIGLYGKIVGIASSGASVPLTGFGYALATGVEKAVDKDGLLGALTGGMTATSAGVTAALITGYITAILFKSKDKNI